MVEFWEKMCAFVHENFNGLHNQQVWCQCPCGLHGNWGRRRREILSHTCTHTCMHTLWQHHLRMRTPVLTYKVVSNTRQSHTVPKILVSEHLSTAGVQPCISHSCHLLPCENVDNLRLKSQLCCHTCFTLWHPFQCQVQYIYMYIVIVYIYMYLVNWSESLPEG